MGYAEEYKQKLVTADQAAAVIRDGDWVDYGWTATTNVAVDKALAKRMPEMHDVQIYGGILMHVPEIFKIENPQEHFTWNSWHMSGIERKMASTGLSFYAPIKYSELPRYYLDREDPLDVAIMQVGPMDKHGYFNLGPSASHTYAVVKMAKKVTRAIFEMISEADVDIDEEAARLYRVVASMKPNKRKHIDKFMIELAKELLAQRK